jgi:hypothetical protein
LKQYSQFFQTTQKQDFKLHFLRHQNREADHHNMKFNPNVQKTKNNKEKKKVREVISILAKREYYSKTSSNRHFRKHIEVMNRKKKMSKIHTYEMIWLQTRQDREVTK